jgi:hypothetical protein
MRDDSNAAQMIPQDYDALQERLNSVSEKEERGVREFVLEEWSNGLFGIDSDHKIIPHDGESSNAVFNGMYHDGDPQAVVDLNNEYRDSELFTSGVVVSAEYTEDGWKFHRQENYEMGDKLPSHQ